MFTGADTKIMLNQGARRSLRLLLTGHPSLIRMLIYARIGETPAKRSKIEKETNFNVIAKCVSIFFLLAKRT